MKHKSRLWIALAVLVNAGLSRMALAQVEPKAGTWKTWVLTSGSQLRLPPPPDAAASQAEMDQLQQMESQRDAALLDRVNFWNAGPPGFRWNAIAIPPGPANAVLNTRIMSLLSIAIYDATVAAWDSKYAYNRPRPSRLQPAFTTVLLNPETPSYPSEHAVVAGAASTVLSYLFPARADAYAAMAQEAAQVWVQAGLNYPSDAQAGLDLGRAVAAMVVRRAMQDGSDMTGSVDIPAGPCRWTGINPATPFTGSIKTWVLLSGSQLRPGPPPLLEIAQFMGGLLKDPSVSRRYQLKSWEIKQPGGGGAAVGEGAQLQIVIVLAEKPR